MSILGQGLKSEKAIVAPLFDAFVADFQKQYPEQVSYVPERASDAMSSFVEFMTVVHCKAADLEAAAA